MLDIIILSVKQDKKDQKERTLQANISVIDFIGVGRMNFEIVLFSLLFLLLVIHSLFFVPNVYSGYPIKKDNFSFQEELNKIPAKERFRFETALILSLTNLVNIVFLIILFWKSLKKDNVFSTFDSLQSIMFIYSSVIIGLVFLRIIFVLENLFFLKQNKIIQAFYSIFLLNKEVVSVLPEGTIFSAYGFFSLVIPSVMFLFIYLCLFKVIEEKIEKDLKKQISYQQIDIINEI